MVSQLLLRAPPMLVIVRCLFVRWDHTSIRPSTNVNYAPRANTKTNPKKPFANLAQLILLPNLKVCKTNFQYFQRFKSGLYRGALAPTILKNSLEAPTIFGQFSTVRPCNSLIHLFIHSIIHSFVHSFICSFIHSNIH